MNPPETILRFFFADKKITRCTLLPGGKVNDTWLVHPESGPRLILQRLPKTVFSDPEAVMRNISITTGHLQRFFMRYPGSNLSFYTLHTNQEGRSYYVDPDGGSWRLISYIPDTRTLAILSSHEQCREIGRALGLFHTAMASLAPDLLSDPLPGLHNTCSYLQTYDAACKHRSSCTEEEAACSRFIDRMRDIAFLFHESSGTFSHLIIHGDPKVTNFLFAQESDTVVSLIDLDTVKPGFLLHDLGDCLRSCCNLQGEEHEAPGNTVFNVEYCKAVLQGYGETGSALLTGQDIASLVDAVKLICFELGLRFFTDHLQGDIYFKTQIRGENLKRALIQFHLAQSVDRQRPILEGMIDTLFREAKSEGISDTRETGGQEHET